MRAAAARFASLLPGLLGRRPLLDSVLLAVLCAALGTTLGWAVMGNEPGWRSRLAFFTGLTAGYLVVVRWTPHPINWAWVVGAATVGILTVLWSRFVPW